MLWRIIYWIGIGDLIAKFWHCDFRWQLVEQCSIYVVRENGYACVCASDKNYCFIIEMGFTFTSVEILNHLVGRIASVRWYHCRAVPAHHKRSRRGKRIRWNWDWKQSKIGIIRRLWLVFWLDLLREIVSWSRLEAKSSYHNNGTRSQCKASSCPTKRNPSKKSMWCTKRACAFCKANNWCNRWGISKN